MIICQRPSFIEYATHELTARGTSHSLQVCLDDLAWAKQQLAEDFPGRRVERAVIAGGESVVTYVGDPAAFGIDDADGW
jgi:hypothetical protein